MFKILLADDEEHIRLLVQEELSDAGYYVIAVDRLVDILNVIDRETPDLVVLDIQFDNNKDKNNGLTVLRRIRSRNYNLPVILFSAYAHFRNAPDALAADYYVVKRSDLGELKSKIKMCLEAHKVDFSRLHFGAPVAERDVRKGLLEYFVESEHFKQAAAGAKQILLGNRGTGKSAIIKVLESREKQSGSIVIQLSPDEFSYEMVKDVMAEEDVGAWARQVAYTAALQYLIYVLVMREFVRSGKGLQTGPSGRVYQYIRDNHGGG